jgi:hypothetical protein
VIPDTVDGGRRWLVLMLAAATALLGVLQFARLTEIAVQISGMSGAPSWLHLLLHWEWPDQVLWSAPIAAGVGGMLALSRWYGWFGGALVAVASLTLVVATVVSVREWGWSSTVQLDPLSGRPLVAVPLGLALALALLSTRPRPVEAVGS